MTSSPHLPPPACHVPTHHIARSLSRVLFTVFIGCLSGMTAAFVAVAWIVPAFVPSQSLSGVERGRRSVSLAPSPTLVQQTRQRMLRVYDARKKVTGSVYHDGALMAEAVLLSSDGWAVIAGTKSAFPDPDVWEGVDSQGIVHRAERVIFDAKNSLAFARFDGQGFRIMPFADWGALQSGSELWGVSDGVWKGTSIDSIARIPRASAASILESAYTYDLLPFTEKKSILLSDEGFMVGFSDGTRIATSNWQIEYELQSILDRGDIEYRGFPWRGVYVSGRLQDGAVRETPGFYLENVGASRGLRAGDIVLRIDGKSVDSPDVPRHILFSADTVPVTILRNGEEMDVTVGKSLVKAHGGLF